MNNGIAIYYNGVTIYWSSILIVMGILSCIGIGCVCYGEYKNRACIFWAYVMTSLELSFVLSRFLYWACFQEQFDSMIDAFADFNMGGFLIPGVIIACWFVAWVFKLLGVIPSSFYMLDVFAIGFAFMIGIFKLSVRFSDTCRGKLLVTVPLFQRLPFSEAVGSTDYRFATYYMTFLCMMLITVGLAIAAVKLRNKATGDMFRLFLLAYGLLEVIMDSTRYDAAHITIKGELFEGINKASGFMGFGQLFAAFSLIYVFVYYFVILVKADGWRVRTVLILVGFVAGFAVAGVSEYLVQRFTSMIYQFYGLMLVGLVIIGVVCGLLYRIISVKPCEESVLLEEI